MLEAGAPVDEASVAMILVHGRGGSAAGILALAAELERPQLAYLAPQASGGSWYPQSFLAAQEQNEPGLSSGLALIGSLVDRLGEASIPEARLILGGFSQGACLALEFAARNARRYGGVFGLTGGLIGPAGTARDYPGSFDGAPVFLGASNPDPYVPWERVEETSRVFSDMEAEVTKREYSGMGHTVNQDEVEVIRRMIDDLSK